MPAAIPIIAGAALGAGTPLLGAAIAGTAITAAVEGSIIAGALIGAAAGALPLVLSAIFTKDTPSVVATGRIEDVTLTTFTRTGSIPAVYGFREVGCNVIHLGNTEFKDVVITSTTRSESHLYAEVLLGVAEGPCREALAFEIGDTPQRIGTWRFQAGTALDLAEPELNDDAPPGRNFRYPHTAKVYFSGDLGFVSNIPDFKVHLRGIYPDLQSDPDMRMGAAGVRTVAWKPQRATIDGPTNTLVISPDPATVESPQGVVTYRMPFEDGPPLVKYTRPPAAITADGARAFYFGYLDAVVFQDPGNPRMWYVGSPGLDRDSEEWLPIDLGEAFDAPTYAVLRDDRTCKTHSLHRHEDGWWFIVSVSWLTMEPTRLVLPPGGFDAVVHATFKAEDSAWYMAVTGQGPDRVVRYSTVTGQWSTLAEIGTENLVNIIKLGVLVLAFYSTSVTQIDAATGEVIEGLPLSDYMAESDANALGTGAICLGVAVSRHRYAGVAVFASEDQSDWRISVFHEARAPGDSFPRPAPFRRWMLCRASAGTYLPKPGFPVTPPPMEHVVWVSNDIVQASKSAQDMIADGADFKTTTAAAEIPEFLRPTGAGGGTPGGVSIFGAATIGEAVGEAVPDDALRYVHLQAHGGSPSSFTVALTDPGRTIDPAERHILSFRHRSQNNPSATLHRIEYQLAQGSVVIATTGIIPHLAINTDLWMTGHLELTGAEVAAISNYGDLRLTPIVSVGVGFPIFAGFDITWAELKIGGSPQVQTLATGLTAYSYYPVHENRREQRRVLFVSDSGDGLDWWFTVKGGASCGDRDFAFSEVVTLEEMEAAGISDTSTQLTDDRRSLEDDFYVGWYVAGNMLFFARVLAYDAATGILTHEEITIGPGFVNMQGPEWSLRHWSIETPTQLEVPSDPGSVTENPAYFLEGRYVGRGWTRPDTVDEIIETLRDNGWPGDAVPIVPVRHPGTHTLTGTIYYQCGLPGANRCEPAPTPVVANMPLQQYRLDTADFPEVIYNTASALGEAEMTDLMLEWTDHNITGGACSSFSLVRDCFGIDAADALVTVAAGASVASWESSKIVVVQEEKTKWTTISVTPTGYRHDWFEGRTTPAAIRVHYLINDRFGVGRPVEKINIASHLGLHGYSLEQVSIDGQRIRRFIWNVALAQGLGKRDLDERVLAAAGASGISEDGLESVVFETSGTETIMEFDPSMIAPDSLSVAVKSANAAANRVIGRFFNALDRREDSVAARDEDNQQATGSVREREVIFDCITDPRRVFLVTAQSLSRALVDRFVMSFTTGSFARTLLNAGDPVSLSDPRGRFRRRPGRITSMDDSAEDVNIELESISAYTTDDRVDPRLRDPTPTTGANAGSFGASSMQRDTSIERFHGIGLAPVRTLAALRDDGAVLLLGARAPNSRLVAGVRASLRTSTEARELDSLPVGKPRSVALMDDLIEDGPAAFRGLIDTSAVIALPASAYALKRTGQDPAGDRVLALRVTGFRGGSALDPEGEGLVTLSGFEGDPMAVDRNSPTAVWSVTEDDASPHALEPVRYDGEQSPAGSWRNPGDWLEITGTMSAITPEAALSRRGDYLVIGWSGDGSWLPNSLYVSLDTPALVDQAIVAEYSCDPDPRTPLRVWKPLSLLDGTLGMTQSGRIHLEIPADWRATRAWDQHGNRIPGTQRMYLVRLQRRQRSGAGVSIAGVTLENRPLLLIAPPAAPTVRLPELSQGETALFRFASRSDLAAEETARQPASVVQSTGGRWRLLQVSYPRLVLPEEVELEDRDSLDPGDGADLALEWQYASASHGWGAPAFGMTALGVESDPHLRGAIVEVRRQSDGEVLRRQVFERPENLWSYPWAERSADGGVGLDVVIVQYDDRGFYGPELVVSLERPGAS